MSASVSAPAIRIEAESLTAAAFSPFGTVIVNPESGIGNHAIHATSANQGTALKYVNVSQLNNYYFLAPSRKLASPTVNLFVCSPRHLRVERASTVSETPLSDNSEEDDAGKGTERLFDVTILERHPFTSQTFIPLGVSPEDDSRGYLVIVAPTLPVSASGKLEHRQPAYPRPDPRPKRSLLDAFTRARPSPFTNEAAPPNRVNPIENVRGSFRPKGTGLPDLSRVRAFVARGDQAVTYAAGTWHAPMAVLSPRSIDFVVIQYANGVEVEDCQEVLVRCETGQEGLCVDVNIENSLIPNVKARL